MKLICLSSTKESSAECDKILHKKSKLLNHQFTKHYVNKSEHCRLV